MNVHRWEQRNALMMVMALLSFVCAVSVLMVVARGIQRLAHSGHVATEVAVVRPNKYRPNVLIDAPTMRNALPH